MQQRMVKKTIELDERAVKRLRIIFNADTDKEAVNRAMMLVAEEDQIIRTHESLAGKVKIRKLFS